MSFRQRRNRSAVGVRVKADAWQQWLGSRSGQRLLAMEAGWLREVLVDLRGQHLLYSGIEREPRFLRRHRMRHAFNLGMPWSDKDRCAAISNDDQWPLEDDSIDAIILQHSLDMSTRPHQMIREASRVLKPSGYIVIVGFTPYSVFGAIKALFTLSNKLPWVSNCVAARRLQDWLTLLDFRIERVSPVAHLWPLRLLSESASRRFDRVLAGRSGLPANAYILVARKTIAGMSTTRQRRWQLTPEFGTGAAIARVPQNHSINQGSSPTD